MLTSCLRPYWRGRFVWFEEMLFGGIGTGIDTI